MRNCKTCAKAIFNETWGEHRCKITENQCPDKAMKVGCAHYKKGKPAISQKSSLKE